MDPFDQIIHANEQMLDPMRGRLTQELKSLDALAARLLMLPAILRKVQHHALKAASTLIENDAREQIGHYQGQHGEYPEWAPLAQSTEEEKARLGYPADAPLLRKGDLQKSFSHSVEGLEAVVGSTDPVMVYHEFGTSKMPPRPVLGPALFKNRGAIQKLIGFATVSAIIEGERADLTEHFGEQAHHFGGDL